MELDITGAKLLVEIIGALMEDERQAIRAEAERLKAEETERQRQARLKGEYLRNSLKANGRVTIGSDQVPDWKKKLAQVKVAA